MYAHFCPDCYSGKREPEIESGPSPWGVIPGLLAAGFLVVMVVALAAMLLPRD